MSDIKHLIAYTHRILKKIASQAGALGIGLENAAPNKGSANLSVQYLLAVSKMLTSKAEECEALLSPTLDSDNNNRHSNQ